MASELLSLFSLFPDRIRTQHPLRFVAVLFALCLGAGATAQSGGPGYLIGPGDQLEIIVRGEPALSITVPVRPDGRVTIPLVEDLLVGGKTTAEVKLEIERRLTEYLRSLGNAVVFQESQADDHGLVFGEPAYGTAQTV